MPLRQVVPVHEITIGDRPLVGLQVESAILEARHFRQILAIVREGKQRLMDMLIEERIPGADTRLGKIDMSQSPGQNQAQGLEKAVQGEAKGQPRVRGEVVMTTIADPLVGWSEV